MSTMNISLPEDMRAFIDEQVRTRGYMSASEYIRELVRHQQDVQDFRAKIRAGMEGPFEDADVVMTRLRKGIGLPE